MRSIEDRLDSIEEALKEYNEAKWYYERVLGKKVRVALEDISILKSAYTATELGIAEYNRLQGIL